MSATPEVRREFGVRHSYATWVPGDYVQRAAEFDRWLAAHDAEVLATVTPVVPQGAATPADERLCEAADRRGFVMLRDDATVAELARADREFVDTVLAVLATPADETTLTFDRIAQAVEAQRHVGHSSPIGAYVAGRDHLAHLALTASQADEAARIAQARREGFATGSGVTAGSIEVAAPPLTCARDGHDHDVHAWRCGYLSGLDRASAIARLLEARYATTPPVAATSEEEI